MSTVIRLKIIVDLGDGLVIWLEERQGDGLSMVLWDGDAHIRIPMKSQEEADRVAQVAFDWQSKYATQYPLHYDANIDWGTIRFWAFRNGFQIEAMDDEVPAIRLSLLDDEQTRKVVDALYLWCEKREALA